MQCKDVFRLAIHSREFGYAVKDKKAQSNALEVTYVLCVLVDFNAEYNINIVCLHDLTDIVYIEIYLLSLGYLYACCTPYIYQLTMFKDLKSNGCGCILYKMH